METLDQDSFQRIDAPGDAGASLACGDRDAPEHFVLLRQHAGKLVALGYGDRVRVFDRADCTDLPLRPVIAPGALVLAPLFGRFQKLRIRRIEPALARVTASYEGPARQSRVVFPWLDLLVADAAK